MKCPYCKRGMNLKRFIKENYDGEIVNERFVYVCDKCKIVLSPSLVLITQEDTEKEKQIFRELYFEQDSLKMRGKRK